jgi:predicted GNAT family N-acyltransferase
VSGQVRVRIAPWPENEEAIQRLRGTVFTAELGIDAGIDFDGSDAGCLEALATTPEGTAVGTGRLRPDGQIGRVAVLAHCRGRGIGAEMLEALVAAARNAGHQTVWLHAQTAAVGFYERRGFARTGDAFVEIGIEHVEMRRSL